jgi:heme exporter protein B
MSVRARAVDILVNDLRREWRSRFAVNAVLVFVAAALFVAAFLLKATEIGLFAQSGLLWLILLFAGLSSLSRSFVAEADRHTDQLLRWHADPLAVFFGKFGFNLLFTLGFASVTVFLYAVLLRIGPESPGILAVALFLGCLGFTAVATLMAALVSQTNQRHSLFSVIALPLLVPLLLIAGQLTHIGFSGASNTTWLNDALALLGYAGTMITASALLFETIWEA